MRRNALQRLCLALALLVPGLAAAQNYPSQDIRLICAFPAGGGADVLVRHFAEKLRPIVNRTVIVENKAGAGGNIATEYVARAKPDGYTIYVHAGLGGRRQPEPVQEAAGRRAARHPRRRDDQSPAIHARGRRQESVQDRRRSDRRDEAEGRQGELCDVRSHRPHHGRTLQDRDGPQVGRGELPDRVGLAQRDDERQDRLRHARAGVCARAGARRPLPHSGGRHRQTARCAARPADDDGSSASRWT